MTRVFATFNSPQIIGDIHLTIKELKEKPLFLKKKKKIMLVIRPPHDPIYVSMLYKGSRGFQCAAKPENHSSEVPPDGRSWAGKRQR